MHNAGHDLWLRMSHDHKDYILDNRDAKKELSLQYRSSAQYVFGYIRVLYQKEDNTMQYLYKLKYTKKVISVLLCRQF